MAPLPGRPPRNLPGANPGSLPGTLHVVAYDIACPKRWRRVFKLMKQRGAHRQLSVFLVRASGPAIRALGAELARLIDPEKDAVLILPVDAAAAARMIELGLPGDMPGARIVIV